MIFYLEDDARQLHSSMIRNGSQGALIADDFNPAHTLLRVADKLLPLSHDVFFHDLRRMNFLRLQKDRPQRCRPPPIWASQRLNE